MDFQSNPYDTVLWGMALESASVVYETPVEHIIMEIALLIDGDFKNIFINSLRIAYNVFLVM